MKPVQDSRAGTWSMEHGAMLPWMKTSCGRLDLEPRGSVILIDSCI